MVFETGPLSIWFYHALSAAGLPATCIDARHAKAALDMAPNQTDANDADGLAHLAEIGFTASRWRRINRWEKEDIIERMAERLAMRPDILVVRKSTVEHPFGTIKQSMKQGAARR